MFLCIVHYQLKYDFIQFTTCFCYLWQPVDVRPNLLDSHLRQGERPHAMINFFIPNSRALLPAFQAFHTVCTDGASFCPESLLHPLFFTQQSQPFRGYVHT